MQVVAHGAAPTPHALACLQAVLAPALGAELHVAAGAAIAYGLVRLFFPRSDSEIPDD